MMISAIYPAERKIKMNMLVYNAWSAVPVSAGIGA